MEKINAMHCAGREKNFFGGAGVISTLMQEATDDHINWIKSEENIKFKIVYGKDDSNVKKILHVISGRKLNLNLNDYDKIISCSEHIHNKIISGGFKSTLIENIGRQEFTPGPKTEQHDKPILLYCGTITAGKGVDVLIQAVRDLDCELWLLGYVADGSLIRKSSNNVKLLGVRSIPVSVFRNADIFVFPSRSEGMSLALLEAMSVGLPCIVSDIPANKCTCKEAAIYTKVGSPSELREAIKKLIESKEKQIEMKNLSLQMAAKRPYSLWKEQLLDVFKHYM